MSVNFEINNKCDQSQPLLGSMALGTTWVISDFSSELRQSFSFLGKSDPGAMAALGLTSVFNLFTGAFSVYSGWKEHESCDKIGDIRGKAFAALRMFRGAIMSFGGAIAIPLRGLTIAEFLSAGKVNRTALQLLGAVGSKLSAITSSIAILIAGNNLYHATSLKNRVQVVKESEGAVAALKLLKDECAQNGVERENLRRASSSQCIERIGNAGYYEADDVVQEVLNEAWRNQCFTIASIALSSLSLIAMGIAMVSNPATPLLAAAVISLLSGAGWLVVDGLQLKRSFENQNVGKYDHLWILGTSVVGATAVGGAVALACQTSALAVAAAVGTFWLGLNLYWLQQYRNFCYAQKV